MVGRDPLTITKGEVDAIGSKFGMSAADSALGVTDLYDAYLQTLVPFVGPGLVHIIQISSPIHQPHLQPSLLKSDEARCSS